MKRLSVEDVDQIVANVKALFHSLPSANHHQHSAWAKELVPLLLCGVSPAGQAEMCPLAPTTIYAYTEHFDANSSLLLHQRYPKNLHRTPALLKEADVKAELDLNYSAAKSRDQQVVFLLRGSWSCN